MRADDGDRHRGLARRPGHRVGLAARAAKRAARRSRRAADRRASASARPKRASAASWPRGAMKVTPNGRPLAGEARRQRQRAPAEQVDEVGVGAELARSRRPARHRPRRGADGRARSAPSARRRRSHIARRVALQRRATRSGRERRRSRSSPRAASMTARTVGSIASGWRSSRLSHDGVRSATQGPRRAARRSRAAARSRSARPRAPSARSAAIGALVGRGRSRRRRGRSAASGRRRAARARPCCAARREVAVGVGVVAAFDERRAPRAASATREGEDRHAVEAAARRHHAARADAARRRLQADDVVEAGRHAARAGGVGAERERHFAARDDDRRARARAAADAVGGERAARPRRRASACRPGRSRTGRGWSCRRRRRRPRSASATQCAWAARSSETPGRPRSWRRPATSMLSLTANGTPKSGIVRRSSRRVAAARGARFERCDLAHDAVTVDQRDPHPRRALRLEAPLQGQERLARRGVAHRCGEPVVNREQCRIGHATVWCALVYRCVYCTKCAGLRARARALASRRAREAQAILAAP